jgi:predicted AAA+ superfamily ATPase
VSLTRRNITDALLEALSDRPVVLLNGARQSGKSTLVKQLEREGHPARYVSLDDPRARAAALADPQAYVAALDGPVIIDEVQRAPGLFLAIKAAVDLDRTPGRFLLTGSADVMLLPGLGRELVGRMEVRTLWPLSQGEIAGVRDAFVEAVFQPDMTLAVAPAVDRCDIISRVVRGGFPELVLDIAPGRRDAWFESYLALILQREVTDLASVERTADLPRLLTLLAARVSGLSNSAELSRVTSIPKTTLLRYLALLQAAYVIGYVPAWAGDPGRRLVKAPKLTMADTGFACHLLGIDADRIGDDGNLLGPLLEDFVAMELRKQLSWTSRGVRLHHFRSAGGAEVDFVLEDRSGGVVGIEMKAGANVGARDFRGLRELADRVGDRFVRGVVLNTGADAVAFGPRLVALPVSSLWTPVR